LGAALGIFKPSKGDTMNKELTQRASDAADRMTRAGMTLSAGIMQELIADEQRLAQENAAQAEYIRFLETELMQVQAGETPVPESRPLRELRLDQLVLAGEMNN
jgi:hypothetical protein